MTSPEASGAVPAEAEAESPAPSPSDAWLHSVDDADPWDDFFDPGPLRAWSEEVRARLSEGAGRERWSLAGPNIVVESEDEEGVAALLKRVALDAGIKFARIPAEAVPELSNGLRAPLAANAPVLAMIDWGLWSWGNDPESTAFAIKMRRQLSRFDPASPVLFAVCAASSSQMCADLLKIGAFDRVLSLHSPTPLFVGEHFVRLLGEECADDSLKLAPAKAGLVLQSNFPDRDGRALAALRLKRRHAREGRRATLADLTELTIRGIQEASAENPRRPSGEASRRRTAYHEAGHACIAVIASKGQNIPDYASIVPAKDFEGIVLESLAFHDAQDDFTFESLLLRTRIMLAGRAGEEMFCGPTQVSNGANSDLAKATRLTYNLFAHSGFHSGMERGETSGTHLAVLPRGDDTDPLQSVRINRDVRTFLANQYAYVTRTLEEHRAFVDAVASRLLWDPVIDQAEMVALAAEHGVISQPPSPAPQP